VEHAASFDAVRQWRIAAILASGIAALELLALIAAGVLLLGRPFAHHTTRAAAAAKPAPVPAKRKAKPVRKPTLTRARTRVMVLNGNGQTGAAAAEAASIRARGYRISAVGNAPTQAQGPTLVMYRPGFSAEAKRLARDAGIGIVTALDGLKTSSLHRAQLVIVLGN
jgi:LytR cell envelope-related transcriptional attenuator